MVTKGGPSTTSALEKSTRWPVDHTYFAKANAVTSAFSSV